MSHLYGTRSKTKAAPVSVQSVEINTQSDQKGHLGLASVSEIFLVPSRMQ